MSDVNKNEDIEFHRIGLKPKRVIYSTGVKPKKTLVINPVKEFEGSIVTRHPAEKDETFSQLSFDEQSEGVGSHPQQESGLDSQEMNRVAVEQSQKIIKDAKESAKEEVASYRQEQIDAIQSELEQLKKSAYQEGFDQGKLDAESQLASQGEELLAHINHLSQLKKESATDVEAFSISLGVAMASRILKREFSGDEALFKSLFQEAFEKITQNDHVIIEINPEDRDFLDAYQESFQQKFKDIERLEIHEVDSMMPGGCRIETKLGYIDASIETKLSLLEKALKSFYHEEKVRLGKEVVSKEAPEEPSTMSQITTDQALYDDEYEDSEDAYYEDEYDDEYEESSDDYYDNEDQDENSDINAMQEDDNTEELLAPNIDFPDQETPSLFDDQSDTVQEELQSKTHETEQPVSSGETAEASGSETIMKMDDVLADKSVVMADQDEFDDFDEYDDFDDFDFEDFDDGSFS